MNTEFIDEQFSIIQSSTGQIEEQLHKMSAASVSIMAEFADDPQNAIVDNTLSILGKIKWIRGHLQEIRAQAPTARTIQLLDWADLIDKDKKQQWYADEEED